MLSRNILLLYLLAGGALDFNLLGQPTVDDATVALDNPPTTFRMRGDWSIVEDPTSVGGTALTIDDISTAPYIYFANSNDSGVIAFKARSTGERDASLYYKTHFSGIKRAAHGPRILSAEWTEHTIRKGYLCTTEGGVLLDNFSILEGYDVFVDEPEMGMVNVTPNKAAYKNNEAVAFEATPDPGHRFYRWETAQSVSQPLGSNPITLDIQAHTDISPVYLLPIPMTGGDAYIESIWDPNPTYDETFGGEAILNDFIIIEVEGPGLLAFDFLPEDDNENVTVTDNQCAPRYSLYYSRSSDSGVKRFTHRVLQSGPVTVKLKTHQPELFSSIAFTQGEALKIETVGEGVVNKTPNKLTHEIGEPVTLTAQPADGWFFAGWTGNVASDKDTLSFPAYRDFDIVANFIIQGSRSETPNAILPTTSGPSKADSQITLSDQADPAFQSEKQNLIGFELPDSGLPIGNLSWMRSNIGKIADTQPMLENWTSSVTGTDNDQFNFTSPYSPSTEDVQMISFSVNGPGVLHMLPAFVQAGPEWEKPETGGSFQVFMDGELVDSGANWILGSSIVDVDIESGSHVVAVVGIPYRIDALIRNPRDYKFGVQGVTYQTGYRLDVSSNAGTITVNPESQIARSGRNITVSTASTTYANRFRGWSGAYSGTQNPVTVRMNNHGQLRAEYVGPTSFGGLPASYGGDSLFAQALSNNLQALGRDGARSKSWIELKLGSQGYILDTKVHVRSEKENEALSFTVRLDGEIIYNRNVLEGNTDTNKVYIPPEAEIMRIEIEIPEGRDSVGTLSSFNLIKQVPVTYEFLTRKRFEVTPYKEMYAPGEIITYTLIDPAPPNSAIELDLLSGDIEFLPIADGPYAKEVQVRVISGGEFRISFIEQKGDEMLEFDAPLTTDRVLKGNDAFLVRDTWLTARGPSVITAWIWLPTGAIATIEPMRFPDREYGVHRERNMVIWGTGKVWGNGDWKQISIATEAGDDGIMITGSSSQMVMDEIVVQSGYGFNFVATNGSISIDSNSVAYEKGELLTLTATPNTGYEFSGWNNTLNHGKNQIKLRAGISQELRPNFNQPAEISGHIINIEGTTPDLRGNSGTYDYIYISDQQKGISRISTKITGPSVFQFSYNLRQGEPQTDHFHVELDGKSYAQAHIWSGLVEVQIPDGEHEVGFWYNNGGSMTGTISDFETIPGYSVLFPEINNIPDNMIVSPAQTGLSLGQKVEFEPRDSDEELTNPLYQKNGFGKYSLTVTKHHRISGSLVDEESDCDFYSYLNPQPFDRLSIDFTDRSLIAKIEPDLPAYFPGTKVTITPIDLTGTDWKWTGDASGQATPLVVTVDRSLKIGLRSTRPIEIPGGFEARTGYQPWTTNNGDFLISPPLTGIGAASSFLEIDIYGPAIVAARVYGTHKLEIDNIEHIPNQDIQIPSGKHTFRITSTNSFRYLRVTPLNVESYQTWLATWTKTYLKKEIDSTFNGLEGDMDGDGILNRDEFLAGTSPIDSNPLVRIEFREFEGTPQLCLVIQDLKVHELTSVLCYFSEEGLSDAFVRRRSILDVVSQTSLNAEGTSELVAPVSQFDDNWFGFQVSYYRESY